MSGCSKTESGVFEREIERSSSILQKGGTLLYPTDTIWGIGCDATHSKAVDKVYRIKARPRNKSMLILLDSAAALSKYVEEVPEKAYQLIEKAQKPLTIIYPHAKGLASNLLADDGSIGIRIASDPFCRQLIRSFDRPIVSTSANVSGDPSPAGFKEIKPTILRNVDYVVNLYKDRQKAAQPSTIVKLDEKGNSTYIRN